MLESGADTNGTGITHTEHLVPPQSIPVSSPFLMPSLQVGTTVVPLIARLSINIVPPDPKVGLVAMLKSIISSFVILSN